MNNKCCGRISQGPYLLIAGGLPSRLLVIVEGFLGRLLKKVLTNHCTEFDSFHSFGEKFSVIKMYVL